MHITAKLLIAFASNSARFCISQAESIPSVNNSQTLAGDFFIGRPSTALSLASGYAFDPRLSSMHQDAGNTGSSSSSGPRGLNSTVQTYATSIKVPLWGPNDSLTAGMTSTSNNTTTIFLAALNPNTLEEEARWVPEVKGTTPDVLNMAYMSLNWATNMAAVSSKQGRIYVVQREASGQKSSMTLLRTIDLQMSGTLQSGELLLNSVFDAIGNIWFTSGAVLRQAGFPTAPGDDIQNSTTIGYIEPNGTIHSFHIVNQMVENGIAVTGTTAFCVTGPSGNAFDKANATGSLLSLSPGNGTDVTINWKVNYSAGSGRKNGAWARGSGSTPSLLDDKYVAITDNADEQIHVLVYHQEAQKHGGCQKTVCSTPVFKPGMGNNDVGLLVHGSTSDDGTKTYGIAIFNNYNATPLYNPKTEDLNSGIWNNITEIVAQTVRVNLSTSEASEVCAIAWDSPIRIPSVPILSTSTGLIYGYTQDESMAREDGLWEWYVIAVDWRVGEEVWRVRVGAGGMLNDDYLPGSLGSNGSFYQSVLGGIVRVSDGER